MPAWVIGVLSVRVSEDRKRFYLTYDLLKPVYIYSRFNKNIPVHLAIIPFTQSVF